MKRAYLFLIALMTLAVFITSIPNSTAAQKRDDCSRWRNLPASVGRVPEGLSERCATGGGGGPVAKAPTDLAFGADHTNYPNIDLVSLVLNTPGVFNLIGGPITNPSDYDFVNGCDFDNSGTFAKVICLGSYGDFFAVDTTTAAVSPIGNLTSFGGEGFTDLATDPTTGYMYAVSTDIVASSLYRIDGPNVATRIGAIPGMPAIIGIGFDNSGQLFGYDLVTDTFYRIDKATGVDTAVGPLGFDANFGQGMDFDEDTNTCYLFAFNYGTFQAELRTCNTSTGATALVGAMAPSSQIGDAGIATGGGGPDPYGLVLEDDRNGSCLTISLLTGAFQLYTPSTTYSGTANLTQAGPVLSFTGTGTSGEVLQGGISLPRHMGNARLATAGGRVLATISDSNTTNSNCP